MLLKLERLVNSIWNIIIKSLFPGLDILKFNKLLNESDDLYANSIIDKQNSIVWYSGNNVRTVKVLDKNNKIIDTIIEKKERSNNVDLYLLNTRISVATELIVNKNSKNTRFCFFRYRERQSRISKDKNWRFDFTKIIERNFGAIEEAKRKLKEIMNADEKPFEKYEVEIEYIGKLESDKLVKSLEDNILMVNYIINDDMKNLINKNNVYEQIFNLFLYTKAKDPRNISFNRDMISKPITMQMKDIGLIETELYSVTEKADGLRMLYFKGVDGEYMLNSKGEVIKTKQKCKIPNTLIDGEYLEDKKVFLAFDILVYDGKDVTKCNLKERLDFLKKAIKKCDGLKMKKFYCAEKPDDIYKYASQVLDAKYSYETDGLIFTPINEPYYNFKTLKWKPPELTTIDFLIRKNRTRINNKGVLYITFNLYVGISRGTAKSIGLRQSPNFKKLFPNININANFYPILFTPKEWSNAYVWEISQKFANDNDIKDNTIVELAIENPKELSWKFLKNRYDKTAEYNAKLGFGNAWKTAVEGLNAFLHPIEETVIRGKKKTQFFIDKASSNSNISQMRKFHNYVKKDMYKKVSKPNVNRLLEVGAGRFGDLNRWIKNNIKEVVAFDIDEAGLEEGKQRLASAKASKEKLPKVTTVLGDASKNWSQYFEKNTEKFDVISIQFAIHFFMLSEDTVEVLINNIKTWLKPNGRLMFSSLDGESVIELLKKNNIKMGETLDLKKEVENYGTKKMKTVFSIKSETTTDYFADVGQQISVFVESIGSFHTEYLVNFKYLSKLLKKNGFKVKNDCMFKKYYEKSKYNMSEAEKTYSFLHRYMIFKYE